MKTLSLLAALIALSTPAFAEGDATTGDAAKGADDFKRCKACHAITAPDGTEVQKGGKTGPNLFGVIGRPVASVADFKYGESITEVGAKGVVWDEAMLATYVADPNAWLKSQLGPDSAPKSKMTFKLAAGGEDVAAYLASLK